MRFLLAAVGFLFCSPLFSAPLFVASMTEFQVEGHGSSIVTVAQYNRRSSQEFDEFDDSDRSTSDEDLLLDGEPSDVDVDGGVTIIESDEFGAFDQAPRTRKPRRSSRSSRSRAKKRRPRRSRSGVRQAMSLLREGRAEQASEMLYSMSRQEKYRSKRDQIKYLLGLSLMEMNLNQAATFQFVSIIKNGSRYSDRSLEKLSVSASRLGDNTLIDYAISRMKSQSFSGAQRDLLNFRTGEFFSRQGEFKKAALFFRRVRRSSSFYYNAKYKEGLAIAKYGRVRSSLRAFNRLIREREDLGRNDKLFVLAKLARARTLYQGKQWKSSIEAYREIPRDSIYWHDALFEQGWAFLMSAQFRSALGSFHSLHSPFYEKHYLPESLVLRSIVYLYICNYQEMEKVARLFDRIYSPVLENVKSYLVEGKGPYDYFDDFNHFIKYWQDRSKEKKKKYRGEIPEMIGRQLLKDGEIKQLYKYLSELQKERQRWNGMSSSWKNSGVGEYARKATKKRIEKVSKKIGGRINGRLTAISDQLQEFTEQIGFLRFEMLSAKKDKLKKRISGKIRSKRKKTIDQDEERDFYVQNGYDYWPFDGEYWLDELGNYHFLGVQTCE